MFIDDSAIEQVEKLSKKYKETWGKEIDYTVMPKGMTVRRHIVRGTNRTLISVIFPLRLCHIGTNCRLRVE